MPPKVKVTKEDIVSTALKLVKEGGAETLNARNIASALNCSTQPIFSNFATMDELQQAVFEAAYGIYLDFLNREVSKNEYPEYKALGMAYIHFAKEESMLFKLLFMRDRNGEEFVSTPDFEASVKINMEKNRLSRERAERLHLEMWAYVHGIAVMLATSFFEPSEELISAMTSDVYMGVRARHMEEEEKNGCNKA